MKQSSILNIYCPSQRYSNETSESKASTNNIPHLQALESHHEYHRTKDIFYVMKLLGHKNIQNTLIYTQLLPYPEEDSFISKVANSVDEACDLVEDGFEYVTGEYGDGGKIFRKRK